MDDFKEEGAIYFVDEIGDDDKYVFITKSSTDEERQEFDISDELYESLLTNTQPEIKLIYENGEYRVYEGL